MDKEKEMTEAVMCAIKYRERIGTPNFELMAKNLIKAGYGNIKQAVKEFAEKLKDKVFHYEEVDGEDICDDIDELINELYSDASCETCPENNNAEFNERNCPKKGECGR